MKIAVALSGGVDSTTVARRLQAAGHDVLGLTLRLCPDRIEAMARAGAPAARTAGLPEHGCAACAAPCACLDATRAARELGLAHEIIDAREIFEQKVIQPFIQGFAQGKTPNPCSLCNREIKFGYLQEQARARGAELLVTGHYARLEKAEGQSVVRRGLDETKDQTYFLALVPLERFLGVDFPLGHDRKQAVQAQATLDGYYSEPRETSTEICFLQDFHYVDFLQASIPEAFVPGDIVDETGKTLGQHQGLPRYTVGQRRGLGVASARPLYVIRLDAKKNQVVVGPDQALWTRQVQVKKINWLAAWRPEMQVAAVIRYRQKMAPARLRVLDPAQACLEFEQPVRAVTPGQIAVFYQGDRLLGGGEIVGQEDAA